MLLLLWWLIIVWTTCVGIENLITYILSLTWLNFILGIWLFRKWIHTVFFSFLFQCLSKRAHLVYHFNLLCFYIYYFWRNYHSITYCFLSTFWTHWVLFLCMRFRSVSCWTQRLILNLCMLDWIWGLVTFAIDISLFRTDDLLNVLLA